MKYLKYLILSSAWIVYIGYGIYSYITSDIAFLDISLELFVGLFAPWLVLPTSIMAVVLTILMAVTIIKKWRYKYWLLALLQWFYMCLIYVSVMALASV